jgi:L-alanine-DL-glutamate epimerase-like enolase superfamily enzyme
MKITNIEALLCDGGWWPWIFVKVETDEGIVGYGECSDNRVNPFGVVGCVEDLKPLLIGADPRAVDALYWQMHRLTRPNLGGVVQKAIAGIEVALWDIKAKALGISVSELFGGPIKDRIRVYWSHCGTYRALYPDTVGSNPIRSYEDIAELGAEVVERGFTALKTNMIVPGEPASTIWTADGNASRSICKNVERLLETFRSAVGDRADIALDLNFNFRMEGNTQIARVTEPFDLMWLELDCYDPQALLSIKRSTRTPICSGESLYTMRQYKSFLDIHAFDVAMVDVAWNGFSESRRIAALADICETPVAPHNYYSHLSTLLSAHFCACVPNLKILEVDVDSVPWRDDLLTEPVEIVDGHLTLPKKPGLGADLNEREVRKRPWVPREDPLKLRRVRGG